MIEGSFPGWTPIAGPDRERVLEDLGRRLETPLPDDVLLLRREVGCYPRHQLVRVRLDGPLGVRESYLLYAPDDPVPLDFTSAPIHELNPRALRIEDAEDAEAYLRFFCFALAGDEGRFFITERVDDLHLEPDAELEPETAAKLDEALHRVRPLPPEPEDEEWHHRFSAPILYGNALFEAAFLVDRTGMVTMVDDEPIATDLPVVEDELGSDRYFVLQRADGVGVVPDEFLERLHGGDPVEDVRILGNVDARGHTFGKPIDVSRATFNGDVTFEGARFQCPVQFERCTFRGSLDLRESRAEGSFTGRRISIGRDAVGKPGAPSVLRAGSLHVEGSLDLRGTDVRGGVDLRGAKIGGDLRLAGTDLAAWSTSRWDTDPDTLPVVLDLGGADVGGDLDFFTHEAAQGLRPSSLEDEPDIDVPGFASATSIVRGTVSATRIEVGGVVRLSGLRCHGDALFDLAVLEGGMWADLAGRARFLCHGTFALPFSRIRGNVNLGGADVGRDLQLFGAHVDGSVFARCYVWPWAEPQRTTVYGSFDVSGIEAADIELEGAKLGHFRAITGDIGRLRLLPGLEPVVERDPEPDDPEAEPHEVVRWRLIPCRLGSFVVQTATLRHAATFSGVHVVVEGVGDLDGLAELTGVNCGGSIQFWTPRALLQMSQRPGLDDWAGRAEPDLYAVESRFPLGLELLGVRTAAELSLVNVKSDGPIRIRDCVIGHDLDLGSHGPDPKRREGQTTTTCQGLELEATACEGDADLSGLRCGTSDAPPAHVLARRFRVAGKLVFSRPLADDREAFDRLSPLPAERIEAAITGKLDLSAAEASHLVISGHSFQEDRPDRGISFERGKFRRFQVVSPFPAWHDSSDLSVERWEIPDRYLLSFLQKSRPLRRSTYLGVERVLRNDGNDEMADEVFRRMRWRVIEEARLDSREDAGRTAASSREEPGHGAARSPGEPGRARATSGTPRDPDAHRRPGPFRRLSFHFRREVSRFLGRTIGWGTQNFKPLLVAALIFPLSVWVFSSPENIIPTTSLLEVTTGLVEDATPTDHGVDWGPGDAAWMALRYQVPVVPILARERWEPGLGALRLALPGDRALVLSWVSAEDYAFTVFLAHWIIWPLFLIGITTKVIRERA